MSSENWRNRVKPKPDNSITRLYLWGGYSTTQATPIIPIMTATTTLIACMLCLQGGQAVDVYIVEASTTVTMDVRIGNTERRPTSLPCVNTQLKARMLNNTRTSHRKNVWRNRYFFVPVRL